MRISMCWKFVVSLLMPPVSVIAQDSLSLKAQAIPDKYFQQVTQKNIQYERQIRNLTQKALNRVIRQERKLQAKLVKVGSVGAKSIFCNLLDKTIAVKEEIRSSGRLPYKKSVELYCMKFEVSVLFKVGKL